MIQINITVFLISLSGISNILINWIKSRILVAFLKLTYIPIVFSVYYIATNLQFSCTRSKINIYNPGAQINTHSPTIHTYVSLSQLRSLINHVDGESCIQQAIHRFLFRFGSDHKFFQNFHIDSWEETLESSQSLLGQHFLYPMRGLSCVPSLSFPTTYSLHGIAGQVLYILLLPSVREVQQNRQHYYDYEYYHDYVPVLS